MTRYLSSIAPLCSLALAVVGLAGCPDHYLPGPLDASADASPGTDSGLSGDATRPDASDSGVADANSACNTVSTSGAQSATLTRESQASASAAGGTVAAGRYELTAYHYIAQSDVQPAATYQVIWEVTGSTVQIADVDPDGSGPRYTATLATSGTAMTMTQTCGNGPATTALTYTATPDSLTLWAAGDGLAPETEMVLTRVSH